MSYDNDLRRWETRRRAIAKHYAQSGSLAVTAKAFDISRERVRQIVAHEGGATNPRGRRKWAKDGQDHTGGSDAASAVGTGVLG